jgi:hypothetical protein
VVLVEAGGLVVAVVVLDRDVVRVVVDVVVSVVVALSEVDGAVVVVSASSGTIRSVSTTLVDGPAGCRGSATLFDTGTRIATISDTSPRIATTASSTRRPERRDGGSPSSGGPSWPEMVTTMATSR